MIKIDVAALHLEPGSIELDAELEARFVGRLTVSDSRGTVFAEDEFPCLELARALRSWCSSADVPPFDFEFDSMSYPEPGLIWIRRDAVNDDEWRVGSVAEPTAKSELASWAEVLQAVDDLAERIVVVAPEVIHPRVIRLLSSASDR